MPSEHPSSEPAPDATAAYSVAYSTHEAMKAIEDSLIEAIASCEKDLREATENLNSLKRALHVLRQGRNASTPSGRPRSEDNAAHPPRERRIRGRRKYRERVGSDASTIRTFALDEIRRAGTPLGRSEILHRMEEAGIRLKAADPLKRIAKTLWMSPEFTHVGDGYWISGEPIPS